MYARTVTVNEEGQRFDRYLHKLLPKANNGFIYKMLRKKNIVLNGARADGSEKLRTGDTVQVYFSDETLEKFMGTRQKNCIEPVGKASKPIDNLSIIYENEHILIVDKPVGLLSQKAKADDFSLNDWLIQYLLENGGITEESLKTFRPSVCNRLDRNTSGIVLCAKSVRGAQMLGDALKERSIRKFYRLYVKGSITEEKTIEGYLIKNEKNNTVQIRTASESMTNITDEIIKVNKEGLKESYIKTKYTPIKQYRDKTLLEVELITGKSHQIRAHLASIGHSLLGDYKYGDRAWNDKYRAEYGVKYQLLHAYKVVFPQLDEPFSDISGREFIAPLPEIFDKVTEI
ncbi:MAG: RluA family pseudouridine synthase [Clostridiales bacterium]|nr:RluA family pseudouridine synthase [Clostridiales bacterium]